MSLPLPLPLRIGVSSNFLHADPERPLFKGKTLQFVEERMALSIHRAGGVPLPLPDLKNEVAARGLLQMVHGLVLAGGADVSPTSYGEQPLQPSWAGDAIRDAYETQLVRIAIDMGVPVLGLCRGIQLVNVALGGTLVQDIQTLLPGKLVHRDWENYDALGHSVRLADGWTRGVYDGATTLEVNSIHHQALANLGRDLVPTAWAPDEIIEAVEWIDEQTWVVGLQWHPEWLEAEIVAPGAPGAGRADGGRIFDAFLQVCAERSAHRDVR